MSKNESTKPENATEGDASELSDVLCPYCNGKAELVTGDAVYPKRPDLHELYFWRCDPCRARVGCHKGTTRPLGRLANMQLRYWKMQAHAAFDPIWKRGIKKRSSAYGWLAKKLKIAKKDCHIGMFDVATCKKVVEICSEA